MELHGWICLGFFSECSWPEEMVQIEMINFFRRFCQEASEHAQPATCRRRFLIGTVYLAHSRRPIIYGLPHRRHSLNWRIHKYHCPCSSICCRGHRCHIASSYHNPLCLSFLSMDNFYIGIIFCYQ